jgi:hypothetical protein
LISLVCLVLNAIALVRCRKSENLDAMNVGWLGVFIAPPTISGRWEVVCHMAHRTVQCASHVTRPLGFDRWSFCLLGHRTVRWCTGQLGGTPDSSVVHRTGPVDCLVRRLARALTFARATVHCSAFNVFCRRPLEQSSRCSAGTPDSPVHTGHTCATPDSLVNYSGAASQNSRR